MSDLQCPATLVFVDPESLGRIALNVAAVYAATEVAVAAQVLSGVVNAATLTEAVQHLADLHRGETVVVVAPPEMIKDALELPDDHPLPVRVTIDSQGVEITGWP
jgi:hypothetical protein